MTITNTDFDQIIMTSIPLGKDKLYLKKKFFVQKFFLKKVLTKITRNLICQSTVVQPYSTLPGERMMENSYCIFHLIG